VLPVGRLVKVGAWEDGRFVGVVIFSRGASSHLGRQWSLDQTEVCELTRVAFREHQTPISRVLRLAVSMLRSSNPGLRLVVSFADPAHGHHGGIYQAAGWVYTGLAPGTPEYFYRGKWRHLRAIVTMDGLGTGPFRNKGAYQKLRASGRLAELPQRANTPKYRYALGLDPAMRKVVESRRLPYPKPARSPDGGSLATSEDRPFDPDPSASL
jgi:hypothetical protein